MATPSTTYVKDTTIEIGTPSFVKTADNSLIRTVDGSYVAAKITAASIFTPDITEPLTRKYLQTADGSFITTADGSNIVTEQGSGSYDRDATPGTSYVSD